MAGLLPCRHRRTRRRPDGNPERMSRPPKALAAAAALTLGLTACAGSDSGGEPADGSSSSSTTPPTESWEYVTEPELSPPVIDVRTDEEGAVLGEEDTYAAIGPKDEDKGSSMVGSMLVDSAGEPVWVLDATEGTQADLQVQEYEGEPVLTYWEGQAVVGVGEGEMVILDESYEEIARLGMTGDLDTNQTDMHETRITEDGTLLVAAYVPAEADLTEVDGPEQGWVYEAVIQEIDLETEEVLFEWSSLDEVPVTDSQYEMPDGGGTEEKPYDYFHINSINYDDDGELLISARNTSGLYKLDHEQQEIIWTLGGESSDFEVPEEATFAFQHDVQRAQDGTLTLFDNANETDHTSRGLRLDVDEEAMTVEMAAEYTSDDERQADTQGNLQELENGNVVIGWGQHPAYSEYTADGELLYDASFGGGTSYRAYAVEWTGQPTQPPTAVRQDGAVVASWNGATEVASWEVASGSDADSAEVVAEGERDGFETELKVADSDLGEYTEIRALDADGEVLETAEVSAG